MQLGDRVRRQPAARRVTFDGSPLVLPRQHAQGHAVPARAAPGSKYCPSHKHLDEDLEARR